MAGVRLIGNVGEFNDDAHDLEQEPRSVMRALKSTTCKGKLTTGAKVDAEMDQDQFYLALTKSGRHGASVHGRRSVIMTSSRSDTEIWRIDGDS
ncbi:hypothetical protein OHA79_10005 [Streptomyces sp. NBC_00841]|nr:hypothetical protein [Streptomyces sp. NBC_00841]WRZ98133.1 hypothetical protein OHA79_10005 [Streptomyces sp. NBC_00841]